MKLCNSILNTPWGGMTTPLSWLANCQVITVSEQTAHGEPLCLRPTPIGPL